MGPEHEVEGSPLEPIEIVAAALRVPLVPGEDRRKLAGRIIYAHIAAVREAREEAASRSATPW